MLILLEVTLNLSFLIVGAAITCRCYSIGAFDPKQSVKISKSLEDAHSTSDDRKAEILPCFN